MPEPYRSLVIAIGRCLILFDIGFVIFLAIIGATIRTMLVNGIGIGLFALTMFVVALSR